MKITVADRPYMLHFHATGTAYPLSADEVRNLLREYPVLRFQRNRLLLPGHNTGDRAQRVSIRPATLGGGASFTKE